MDSIRDNISRLQEPRQHSDGTHPLFQTPREPRPLSDRQAQIWRHIRDYLDLHGQAPGATVASRLLKISPDAYLSACKALVRKGFLLMDGEQTRTIRLTAKQPPI